MLLILSEGVRALVLATVATSAWVPRVAALPYRASESVAVVTHGLPVTLGAETPLGSEETRDQLRANLRVGHVTPKARSAVFLSTVPMYDGPQTLGNDQEVDKAPLFSANVAANKIANGKIAGNPVFFEDAPSAPLPKSRAAANSVQDEAGLVKELENTISLFGTSSAGRKGAATHSAVAVSHDTVPSASSFAVYASKGTDDIRTHDSEGTSKVHMKVTANVPSVNLFNIPGYRGIECSPDSNRLSLSLSSLAPLKDWEETPTLLIIPKEDSSCFKSVFALANSWTMDPTTKKVHFVVTDAEAAGVTGDFEINYGSLIKNHVTAPTHVAVPPSLPFDIDLRSEKDFHFGPDLVGSCRPCTVNGTADFVMQTSGKLFSSNFSSYSQISGVIDGSFRLELSANKQSNFGKRLELFSHDFPVIDVPGLFHMEPKFVVSSSALVTTLQAGLLKSGFTMTIPPFSVQLFKIGNGPGAGKMVGVPFKPTFKPFPVSFTPPTEKAAAKLEVSPAFTLNFDLFKGQATPPKMIDSSSFAKRDFPINHLVFDAKLWLSSVLNTMITVRDDSTLCTTAGEHVEVIGDMTAVLKAEVADMTRELKAFQKDRLIAQCL